MLCDLLKGPFLRIADRVQVENALGRPDRWRSEKENLLNIYVLTPAWWDNVPYYTLELKINKSGNHFCGAAVVQVGSGETESTLYETTLQTSVNEVSIRK